jgi:hypothetical protein
MPVLALILLLTSCAPTTTVPPGPTRAEVKTSLATLLDGDPTAYQRLHIDLVRVVSPQEQYSAYHSCAAKAHVPGLKVDKQGNISFETRVKPGEKEPESGEIINVPAQEAMNKCILQYPQKAWLSYIHSAAQWGYLYDYLAGPFTACLREAGQPAPVIGTRKGFVAASLAGELYSPWTHVTLDRTSAQWKNLVKRCPPLAPGLSGDSWIGADNLVPTD